jgi:hypothetical protein
VTARRRPRTRSDRIPFAELERLVREKSFLRPLPPVVPLHRMGRARLYDHQADDNTNPKESAQE